MWSHGTAIYVFRVSVVSPHPPLSLSLSLCRSLCRSHNERVFEVHAFFDFVRWSHGVALVCTGIPHTSMLVLCVLWLGTEIIKETILPDHNSAALCKSIRSDKNVIETRFVWQRDLLLPRTFICGAHCAHNCRPQRRSTKKKKKS